MTSTKGSPPGKPSGKAATRPAGKSAARPPAKGSGGKGGNRPRGKAAAAPIKPGPPWGLIAIGVAIALFAVAVIGTAMYQVNESKKTAVQRIAGIIDLHKTKLSRNHVTTHVKYAQSPPVGGNHNPLWQSCMGNVYTAQIANEHAVHSLEHGAVWITYRPGLEPAEIAKLVSKVRGKTYLMLSPYPGLKSPISLQGWGYQLRVNSASDKRIASFIADLSNKGAPEPGADCSGGVSKTGTDLKTKAG